MDVGRPDSYEPAHVNRLGVERSSCQPRWELPDEVEAALKRVDVAFAGARLSENFSACRHCFTAHDIDYLRTIPPAEMSNGDLAIIVFKLVSTIGSEWDIAYFVPAALRAQLRGVAVEDAILMKKLAKIPAEHWTAERQTALRAAYEAYFRWRPADGIDLDEPGYRTWIDEMLRRPPHSVAVDRPIPDWDDR